MESHSAIRAWRRVRGFTLVELLVVVAIIAVLMSLLFSAVNSSRENARRTNCANNLKQIGLASLDYATAHGRLPPGYLGPVPPRAVIAGGALTDRDNQFVGVLAFLLPHLEEKSLYDSIHIELDVALAPPNSIWLRDTETWDKAAHHPVSSFLCPSAPRGLVTFGTLTFVNQFFDNVRKAPSIEGAVVSNRISNSLAITNYTGCAGEFGKVGHAQADASRGIFTNRSKTTFAQIIDGSSKTLLFGETLGAIEDNALSLAHSWVGCGALPVGFGFGDENHWANFSSHHPSLVGCCFADGSVRFIAQDVDQTTIRAMAAMRDGKSVDTSSL